jgi:hypothetical protein
MMAGTTKAAEAAATVRPAFVMASWRVGSVGSSVTVLV